MQGTRDSASNWDQRVVSEALVRDRRNTRDHSPTPLSVSCLLQGEAVGSQLHSLGRTVCADRSEAEFRCQRDAVRSMRTVGCAQPPRPEASAPLSPRNASGTRRSLGLGRLLVRFGLSSNRPRQIVGGRSPHIQPTAARRGLTSRWLRVQFSTESPHQEHWCHSSYRRQCSWRTLTAQGSNERVQGRTVRQGRCIQLLGQFRSHPLDSAGFVDAIHATRRHHSSRQMLPKPARQVVLSTSQIDRRRR